MPLIRRAHEGSQRLCPACCLRRRRHQLRPGTSGLTLLEVVVATAVVLVTCTAVTTVIVASARAGGRSQRLAAVDAALLAEAARLRALPLFVPLPADWPERRESVTPSALGELFPHADPGLNTDESRFVVSGDCAGTFQTTVTLQERSVLRTTWMVRCDASGWRPVASAALDGWHAWGGAVMPAEALLVRLEAISAAEVSPEADGAGCRSLTFVLASEGSTGASDPESLADQAEE